jgi:regulatory protein
MADLRSNGPIQGGGDTSTEGREVGSDQDPGPATVRGRRRQEPSVTQRALGFLTRREHSRKELVSKLTSRGMDAAEVETAVARLAGEGWQDDTRFAGSLLRARVSSGYGPVRIRAELATHGLDRDAIARALESFDGDWAEIASDLVRRRFGPVANFDLARQRKAADLLIRRGFERPAIQAAIRGAGED